MLQRIQQLTRLANGGIAATARLQLAATRFTGTFDQCGGDACASGQMALSHRAQSAWPGQQACSSSSSMSTMLAQGRIRASPEPAWDLLQHRLMASAAATQPQASAGSVSNSSTASTSSAEAASIGHEKQEQKPPPLSQDVHYEGPLSRTHKTLKIVSISNTLIAFAAAPAIMTYADHMSYVSRVGLASTLVMFGILTTGALHWIANPYVHELKYHAATQQIDVRTTTLLGGRRWDKFYLSEVQPLPWDRPVATFMANNRFYYIDVYSFPDEDLLKRLTPDESTVPKGHMDDDDDD